MSFKIDKFHFISGSILEGLPYDDLMVLKQSMVRKEMKAGTVIFREGSYPKGVYFLRRGKVKIFQTNADGREQIAYIYTTGETFGYRPILCQQAHPVSAKALVDCVISFIPLSAFLQVLNRSTILSNKLLRNLSHEFSVWINRLTVFNHKELKEKVAISLLILNEKYKRKNQQRRPVEITLSREDFANYVGTTVEPLVRALRYFKDIKAISAKGRKIIILNTQELERIADML